MPRPPHGPGHRGPGQHARALAGSYPVPAGGSSADLAVGSCCRQLGQRTSQRTLWHTQLFACWALMQMKELLFSPPPVPPPPATSVRSWSSRQRRVSFDSSSFLDWFITGLLAMWGIELFPDSLSLPG